MRAKLPQHSAHGQSWQGYPSSALGRGLGHLPPKGEGTDCRKRCAHPLAPSARGLRPQAVGERTVRLPEILRAMARFSPSAPSGHLPRRGRFFDTLRRGAFPFLGRLPGGFLFISRRFWFTRQQTPQPIPNSRRNGTPQCVVLFMAFCGSALVGRGTRRG